jgi:hypothetical protein
MAAKYNRNTFSHCPGTRNLKQDIGKAIFPQKALERKDHSLAISASISVSHSLLCVSLNLFLTRIVAG